MAQGQNLDFNIAANVTGMEEIATLINRVGALEREIKSVQQANAGLNASTNTVVRNGTRYNNVMDAQSRALRNTRQGTQQLGMQINDFATSISTGASVTQAFNQQIGQVGYALSMMGGRLGAVGAFLAGPWGAAITIATMGLGLLWDRFSQNEEKAQDFSEVLFDSTASYEAVIEASREYNQQMEIENRTREELLIGQRQNIRDNLKEAQSLLVAAQARAASMQMMLRENSVAAGQAGLSGIIAQQQYTQAANEAKDSVKDLTTAFENINGQIDELNKEQDKSVRTTRDHSDATRANREETTQAERAARELFRQYSAGLITMQDFVRGGAEVTEMQREQERATMDQVRYLTRLTELLDQATPSFVNLREEIRRQNADLSDMRTIGDVITPDMLTNAEEGGRRVRDIIRGYTDDMKKSFEGVGEAVNDAFKGMVTGAMGWREALRGIINSVIDQLWKLYVTQKIVGMISKFGESLGLPAPEARAIGGPVSANTPYMVGERGPELFVPRGNGTIIPNHNLSGGGAGNISITVDARGAGDPAMVRQQVEAGIAAALPNIVAVAQGSTRRAMSRPRLAGAMG